MIPGVYFDLFLQCETIVEQYEDELIEFFAHEKDNVKDKLCSKRTGMFRLSRPDLWLHIAVFPPWYPCDDSLFSCVQTFVTMR